MIINVIHAVFTDKFGRSVRHKMSMEAFKRLPETTINGVKYANYGWRIDGENEHNKKAVFVPKEAVKVEQSTEVKTTEKRQRKTRNKADDING